MAFHTGAWFDGDRTISTDVCIIGSGAGGAHVAERLAAAGKHVVVLEEGGLHTSDSFDMTEASMYPRLYQGGGARYTVDAAIAVLQGRAVGGSTVVNWTTCYRTPERTFAHWEKHHGVTGPTLERLTPHFERVERRLGVTQAKLEEVNRNNRILWDGAEELGWSAHLMHRNVQRCAHTGYCGMGCPIDAKQSMLVTMLPDAVRLGAEVYANVSVDRLVTNGHRVTGVIGRIRDPHTDRLTPHTVTVEAKCTVLSAGGINSPAVLLRSGLDHNKRTGKRTFLHPVVNVLGDHDEPVRGFEGSPQYVGIDEFTDRGERMAFLIEAAPVFPVYTASYGFSAGAALGARMQRLDRTSIALALGHDGFDLYDFDEGGDVNLDADGAPVLDYAFSPRMREFMEDATIRLAEITLAGGARRVTTTHRRPVTIERPDDIGKLRELDYGPLQHMVSSAHVMGGCAMGPDPKRSVVDDQTLRHHRFENLFVVDGSVFPTSVGVNPQISIYALASWASEHVRDALA